MVFNIIPRNLIIASELLLLTPTEYGSERRSFVFERRHKHKAISIKD